MKPSLILINRFGEQYNKAIYSLLLPYITPLFSPNRTFLASLILVYAIAPFFAIMRFLVPFFIHFLEWVCPRNYLFKSLSIGIGISALCIGLIPTYTQIGILAPCLLVIARAVQLLCISSHAIAGGVCLIKEPPMPQRPIYSGLYVFIAEAAFYFASA